MKSEYVPSVLKSCSCTPTKVAVVLRVSQTVPLATCLVMSQRKELPIKHPGRQPQFSESQAETARKLDVFGVNISKALTKFLAKSGFPGV